MIGTKLGPYEVIEEIGRGGMAVVYRAYQPSVDRDVAIKVILKGIGSDPGAAQRFQREARLIARLEHPHILPVHDFDGAHDPPYIVMRYLDGGTLKDVMRQGLLPLGEIAFLMRQICSALDYAHRQGIVHRDIKPTNVMIDHDGNAFVADLGIARMADVKTAGTEADTKPVTESDTILGTPEYMSPEQALGIDVIDSRVDIYALGVMLFEMLTGQLPFRANTTLAVLMKHYQEVVPSVHAIRPDLPEAIEAVVYRAMAKDPEDRYATALEMAAAVTEALGGTVDSTPSRRREAAGTSLLIRLGGRRTEPKPAPLEQNKPVTALYANAAEYGALVSERTGSEAARRALAELWIAFEKIVADYQGGIFARSENDLLAVWGADTAHEDDAERAVHAALAMTASLRTLGAAFLSGDDEAPPLNIGLDSGMALLTPRSEMEGGGYAAGGFSASGMTVSMANRLAQSAEGTILITHNVFRQVRGVFDMQPGEALKLRGRAEKLNTYVVLRAKAQAFRVAARGVEGVETNMVGREAELKQLQNAFLNAVEDREAQAVTVIAEAGLGKSRLLYEFDKWADLRPERYFIFRGRATATMTERPYALIRNLISLRFEILDNDLAEVAMRKLETGVAGLLGKSDDETAHLIGSLCGFDFSESRYIEALLGDARQLSARARQLFLRLFAALTSRQPVIVELEDIHHADDASLDLISELIAADEGRALLVICLARPSLYDRRREWGSGQRLHARIDLKPLDKRGSRELVGEILKNVSEVPKALRDLLVERSEGNPYYLEELVKMLMDDRVIVKEGESQWRGAEKWRIEESRLGALNVPPTLLGLLEARLDTLLNLEKLTLQRASAIGRIFYDTGLVALDAAAADSETHIPDLPGVLAKLAEHEFIQRRELSAFAGSVEYIFASNLLRDSIYQALLQRQIEMYNRAAAGWLTNIAGEREAEFAALIADYYERSGDKMPAAMILRRAGDRAEAISAYGDALKAYDRALALIEQLGDNAGPEANTLQVAIFLQQGAIYSDQARYPESQAAMERALALARQTHDSLTQIDALVALAAVLTTRGEHEQAEAAVTEAEALAENADDTRRLARVFLRRGSMEMGLARYDTAAPILERALSLFRQLGDNRQILTTLNLLAIIKATAKRWDEAVADYQEGLAVARRIGSRSKECILLMNLGATHRLMGELDAAAAEIAEGLVLSREMGRRSDEAICVGNLGELAIDRQRWDEANQYGKEALKLALDIGDQPLVAVFLAQFGHLRAARGEAREALPIIGAALGHPAVNFNTFHTVNNEIMPLLRETLSEEEIQVGIEAGKALDLDAVLRELLGE